MPNMVRVLMVKPAREVHDREGAEQHHRDGDGRDDRGPEALQEQVHDQEDQDNGFDKRMEYGFNGLFHHRGRIVGVVVLQAGREEPGQLFHFRLDMLGGLQGVLAWGQLDGETGRRQAVKAA